MTRRDARQTRAILDLVKLTASPSASTQRDAAEALGFLGYAPCPREQVGQLESPLEEHTGCPVCHGWGWVQV